MRIPAGLLLAVWVVWAAALALLAISAWAAGDGIQGWVAALQRWYAAGPRPPWYLQADSQVHVVVACLACLWFGVGCRLFAPRTLPWIPIALTILVALSDEVAQLGSSSRTFQWGDQVADAAGILLALPGLFWLRRLEIRRPGGQKATSSSVATRV